MAQHSNMHLACVFGGGAPGEISKSAERLYGERFIAERHLSHPTFANVDMHLHETATFTAYLVEEKSSGNSRCMWSVG
jgi:hypothetical protein